MRHLPPKKVGWALRLAVILAAAAGTLMGLGAAPGGREATAQSVPSAPVIRLAAASGEEEILRQIGQLEDEIGRQATSGNYAAAEAAARRAAKLADEGLGSSHPLVPLEFSTLGRLCLQQKKLGEAAAAYERAFELAERQVVGPWKTWWANHPVRRASIFLGLGEAYLAQGRLREAEPLLNDAVLLHEASGVPNPAARESLAEVYRRTGREDDAQRVSDPNKPVGAYRTIRHRPVVPGVDDRIALRAMRVRLPEVYGWQRRELPIPVLGSLIECERVLPSGHLVQIHAADYFGGITGHLFGEATKGRTDAERLEVLVESVTQGMAAEEVRTSEWVEVARGPQRHFGAVCKELHVVRADTEQARGAYLWQDWMLMCVDPVTHVPFQVDYAERYPADGGAPTAGFSDAARAFFDSVEFEREAR